MVIGIVAPFNPRIVCDYLVENNVPDIHNSATAVNTLVLSLIETGHSVKVFTTYSEVNYIKHLSGRYVDIYLIPTSLFPQRLPLFKHHLLLDPFYMYKRIRKTLSEKFDSLDVIHAHWTYEFALAAISYARNKPVFVTVRDWAPYILSLQNSLIDKYSWWLRRCEFRKVMNARSVHFIANSQYTCNRIIGDYPNNDVTIIPNPINIKYIINNKINPQIKHRFISIAQLLCDDRKNITTLLNAYKIYREKYNTAELYLVGIVEKDCQVYRDWVSQGLLEGVFFLGSMAHDKMMHLMDQMTCLVHPALEETFGNIFLEAMARCVPCIGGEHSGAVPYVLGYGKYGLLCDINNPQSILEAMININDQVIVSSMVNDASTMIQSTYSSDIICKKHLEIYTKYYLSSLVSR